MARRFERVNESPDSVKYVKCSSPAAELLASQQWVYSPHLKLLWNSSRWGISYQYWHTYYVPLTAKHFISFVNRCCMFRSYGPSFGTKMWDFKNTRNKTDNVRIMVTLRRVRATIIAVEKQYPLASIFWENVCSLQYPTCNAHAPYVLQVSSVSWPALQYFYTLSHKQHDFRKKKSYWI